MRPGCAVRLLAAHALAATAMAMPWPALLAAVWARTGSETWLGLTGAARMAPYVLLSAFAGLLADRVRRSTVLRWSTVARVVLLLGCAAATSVDAIGVAVMLAVLAVAAGTPAYPAAVAAMPRLAGPRAGRLTDLLVTAEVTAFVVGPALGGLLIGAGLGAASAWLGAGLTLMAVILLRGLWTPRPAAAAGRAPQGRIRTVLSAPGAGMAIAVVALVNFAESAASVALLTLSHERWQAGDRGFGLATAALGFGSLAAPALGLLVRLRGSLLLTAGGFGAAGLLPAVGPAVVPLALGGAAGTVVECVSTEVLQRSVPDRVRAFSLGLTDGVMVLAAMAGSLVVPLLLAVGGPVGVFLALAAALVIGTVVVRRGSATVAPAVPMEEPALGEK